MGRNKNRRNQGRKKPQNKKQNKAPKATPKPPTPVDKEGEYRVIGLTNLANTCYFNSVLQLLLSSCYLREYFLALDRTLLQSNVPITKAFLELLDQSIITSSSKTVFKPSRVLGAVRSVQPMFKGKSQHDAHELLMVFLHLLVEETEISQLTQNSLSETLFGKLTSIITCNDCGYTKSEHEDFLVISTAIIEEDSQVEGVVSKPLEIPEGGESEMKPDESPVRNNFLEDSGSERREEISDGEDSFLFVPEWFDLEEELETSLSETESTEKANNDASWQRKGKKKKNKKSNLCLEYDQWSDHEDQIEERLLLTDLESCLERFFSVEKVTWRCAGEFPEKRVTFSDSPPEIFSIPSSNQPASPSPSEESSEHEEKEGEELQEEIPEVPENQVSSGLKSCLKTEMNPPKPPVPTLNSTKQYRLFRYPKVLCIHLKRFESGRRRRSVKLTHAVEFALNINLNKFSNQDDSNSINYELRAVVCHSGSLNFGHYTAFVSRLEKEQRQWYDISDSVIKEVSVTRVLKSQAYLLLYEALTDESIPESNT